jgi:hypothetical protein
MPTYARGQTVLEDRSAFITALPAASGGPSSVASTPTPGRTLATARIGFSTGCVV